MNDDSREIGGGAEERRGEEREAGGREEREAKGNGGEGTDQGEVGGKEGRGKGEVREMYVHIEKYCKVWKT